MELVKQDRNSLDGILNEDISSGQLLLQDDERNRGLKLNRFYQASESANFFLLNAVSKVFQDSDDLNQRSLI